MRLALAILVLFPVAFLLACNSTPSGTIQIITDDEAGTFTQTPLPTQITVSAESEDGSAPTTLATSTYAADTIDLGNQDQEAVASVLVQLSDADGGEVIYGSSIPVQYGSLAGETLPIFVQRVGQTARLPNPPAGDARQAPTMGVLSDRFLVIGGGLESATSLTSEVYDFGQFDLLTPAPTLPYVPDSMPLVGTVGMIIDTAGDGYYYDFSASTTNYSFTAPTSAAGFTLADVGGGQTIYDPYDGYVFVVGATRTTGPPTQAVLMINTNDLSNETYETGALSWLTLADARLGASAAWVGQQAGLVVAGGSSTAPGVEVIDVDGSATSGSELAYPPDPSTGAGMTPLDTSGGDILLAGGVLPDGTSAGVRAIRLGCAESCTPTPWAAPPVTLTSAFAFTINPTNAVLIGSELMTGMMPGLTHLFTVTAAAATEVPTRVAHTNATACLSPVGSVVFYGGANGEIESFTPAP